MAVIHTLACWRLVGGRAGIASPYPFLNHDHTFNYYYAVTTRYFLRASGTTAGYDPNFMAGYAKSVVFPSSATLPEVMLFLFAGGRPERAFKLYVLVAAASLPWLFWLACFLWHRRFSVTAFAPRAGLLAVPIALVLFELFFWTDFGMAYVVYGMVPFVLSAPLTLLSAALVIGFLDRGGWSRWIAATLLTALACMTHLSAPFAMFPGLFVAYIAVARGMTWHRHVAAWLIPAISLAANAFWIVPGILLRSTLATTETGIGFINPNVWERMAEFFVRQPPVELTTLVLAAVGLFIWSRRRGADFWAMLMVTLWSFFLGYFAGLFRPLDALQPGRYTLFFFTWAALPAGLAAAWLLECGYDALRPKALVVVPAAVLLAGFAWLNAPGLDRVLLPLLEGRMVPLLGGKSLPTTLPPPHRELIAQLKAHVEPGERILFEERNRGIEQNGVRLPDPLGDLRLAPLIPLETGAEVIGGPYLYTHLKTNFTQFGDGLLMGKPRWTVDQFRQYARIYNVRWIVCWSPYATGFCRTHPKLVDLLHDSAAPFVVGRIVLPEVTDRANDATRGRATVHSRPGKLIVRDIRPEDGMVVLPYHWVPRLVSEPPVQIEPVPLLDDPVPFIGLRNPPEQVELWIELF